MTHKKEEAISFHLDEQETKAYKEFEKECLQELLEKQIKEFKDCDNEKVAKEWEGLTCNWTTAYTGTSGGLVTLTLCPTSIGLVIVVKCKLLDKQKDISNYDTW